MKNLTITMPDDWHVHLRDGKILWEILPDTARRFARSIVMPNLNPPITAVDLARSYRERIVMATPESLNFEPLMTLYLTDNTSINDVKRAKESGIIYAFKYYPAGATTNSGSGVTGFSNVRDVLAAMEKEGIPLLLHGEVADPEIDIYDREEAFIDRHFKELLKNYPGLKIVFEHITTKQAADFVAESPDTVAATITVHHLLLNRNDLLAGGIRPHNYCLPIQKREEHRISLLSAAVSGNKKFFLGTDSAPHFQHEKESACGCAGIYTAHAAIELYAEVFEDMNALNRLEAFASFYGPDFYGLPRNRRSLTLLKEDWTVPNYLPIAGSRIIPFRAGERVSWKISHGN